MFFRCPGEFIQARMTDSGESCPYATFSAYPFFECDILRRAACCSLQLRETSIRTGDVSSGWSPRRERSSLTNETTRISATDPAGRETTRGRAGTVVVFATVRGGGGSARNAGTPAASDTTNRAAPAVCHALSLIPNVVAIYHR